MDHRLEMITAFVIRLYKICLGREPDKGGLDHHVGLLARGDISGGELVMAFFHSTEYLNHKYSAEEFLYHLYRAFFGREPDSGGFRHWLLKLKAKWLRARVIRSFANSPEFINLCEDFCIKANAGHKLPVKCIGEPVPTPGGPFIRSKHGMGLHLWTMGVEEYRRILTWAGPWIRIDFTCDEISRAINNPQTGWQKLDTVLSRLDATGMEYHLVVPVSYWYSWGPQHALAFDQTLSLNQKLVTYYELGRALAQRYGDRIIYEAWNEPDNTHGSATAAIDSNGLRYTWRNLHDGFTMGGPSDWHQNLARLIVAFADGVHSVNPNLKVAFSPFISLSRHSNGGGLTDILQVWEAVVDGRPVYERCHYFSVHQYDDDPRAIRQNASSMAQHLHGRRVIVTEYGTNSGKSIQGYRDIVWALYEGLGGENDEAIINYVWSGASHGLEHFNMANSPIGWGVINESQPR